MMKFRKANAQGRNPLLHYFATLNQSTKAKPMILVLVSFIYLLLREYHEPKNLNTEESLSLRYTSRKEFKACLLKKDETYCIRNCIPCGSKFSLCPHRRIKNRKILPLIEPRLPKLTGNFRFRNFNCSLFPDLLKATRTQRKQHHEISSFDNLLEWHRRPLNLRVSEKEPIRINVLLTGLGRDLTGGPLSIIRFVDALLSQTSINARIINVDGNGLKGSELKKLLVKYSNTESYIKRGGWIHDAMSPRSAPIAVNPKDMFMSTVYFTSLICHETTKHPDLLQKNFLYFIQDFEPIFFPQGSDFMEALETYNLPHFALYSTPFLEKYFIYKKVGQSKYMANSSLVKAFSYASEPAIKSWGSFDLQTLNDPKRTRKVIVYARKHADRNAYDLTIRSLSSAVCSNVFSDEWEFIGTGALTEYSEFLGSTCGRKVEMKIKMNIPEPEYRKIIRSGDIGFSLMISPHPSLPPFDFAAAGLIAVTNTFETKNAESFRNISSNFITAEPFQEKIVEALRLAVQLSSNYQKRRLGADEMSWENEWKGEKCYGPLLMGKIASWFQNQEALW